MGKSPKLPAEYSLNERHQVILAQEKSGLSVMAFCQQQNITTSVFYDWKKLINETFRQDIQQKEENKWRRILKDWKKSGLTSKEYCHKYKIRHFAFQAWEKKLDLDHEEEKKWKAIVEEWKQSGKTIEQFSKDKKVNALRLSKWRKKFYPELAPRTEAERKKQWAQMTQEMKEKGLTKRAISKKYGIKEDTFCKWQKQYDPSAVQEAPLVRSPEEWKEIVESWEKSGMNIAEYCRKNGLGDSTFRQWRRKLSDPAERKIPQKRTKAEWKRIIQEWDESGLSRREFIEQRGLTSFSFYKWLNRFQNSGEITEEFKNHNNVKNKKTTEEWADILKDWKKSKLPLTTYCKLNSLNISTFCAWRKKLAPTLPNDMWVLKSRDEWKDIYCDWKESGLKPSEYSKKSGIPDSTLRHRIKKFSREETKDKSIFRQIFQKKRIQSTNIKQRKQAKSKHPDTNTSSKTQKIEIQFAQGHHLTLEGALDWKKIVPWLLSLLKK